MREKSTTKRNIDSDNGDTMMASGMHGQETRLQAPHENHGGSSNEGLPGHLKIGKHRKRVFSTIIMAAVPGMCHHYRRLLSESVVKGNQSTMIPTH